jgi:hypothetical protein
MVEAPARASRQATNVACSYLPPLLTALGVVHSCETHVTRQQLRGFEVGVVRALKGRTHFSLTGILRRGLWNLRGRLGVSSRLGLYGESNTLTGVKQDARECLLPRMRQCRLSGKPLNPCFHKAIRIAAPAWILFRSLK